ncbi:MAG: ClpXP protease specificity-enhancing factor SspB [Myxococcota bacterium]|nr:ClpXP protease specificity-enhancing factor SspB [Myxococcota bacterium]
MDPRGPEKKERLLNALNLGMVMVHLDARRPGVVVPQELRDEAHLRLNLSYRFDPPDLSVNEWGVRQSLSFGGSRFSVGIPWSALFAVTSHVTKEFWMFVEDLPPELLSAPPNASAESAPQPQRPVGRPQLRTVAPLSADGPEGDPVESQNEVPVERERPPPRPLPGLAAARPLEPQPPEDGQTPEPPREEPPKPRDRSHLRVVK